MSEVTPYLCLGTICLGPIITFALGLAIGSKRVRLPFKIVKVEDDDKYVVEGEE
jgi:hypothetical protein